MKTTNERVAEYMGIISDGAGEVNEEVPTVYQLNVLAIEFVKLEIMHDQFEATVALTRATEALCQKK